MQVVKRIVTALTTATAAVLGLVYVPYGVVLPVMIALVLLVQLEFMQMVSRRHETMVWSGVAVGAVWLAQLFYPAAFGGRGLVVFGLAAGLLFLRAMFGSFKSPLAALGTTVLGIVYIPLMLSAFLAIPRLHGMSMLLYVVAIVKISDMGGFAFGMAFGKHKMCPTISPKKSWEGMTGSIVASVIVSCAFMPLTHFSPVKAVAFGIAAAVVGTLGDLVESRFKRECEVKDSATFMPAGLGGFLDMFDSLVFAPAVLLPFI